MSVQFAFVSHGLLEHSSIFEQFHQSPENPVLHSHWYEPSVSVQLALGSQGVDEHSSMSEREKEHIFINSRSVIQ